MLRKLLVTGAAAMAVSIASLGVGSASAFAEVIFNQRVDALRIRDNPCEPGVEMIPLEGVFHHVWYTTPEGTLKMNIQGHLKGVDANGAHYVLITQQHMEHWAWPTMEPYTDTLRMNLISKAQPSTLLLS